MMARVSLILLNLAFGVAPSLAFFVWVERGATLPVIPLELGWPWVHFESAPLAFKLAWNAGLFALFGLGHSGLAQLGPQRRLGRLVRPQAVRTLYMVVTGLSLTLVMGLWQTTGIVVWAPHISPEWARWLSILIFWSLLALAGSVASRLDALSFIGLRQIYQSDAELALRPSDTSGNPELRVSGAYGWMRHPMYFFVQAAVILAPVMTLDRLLLFFVMIAYLAIGIPLEERKLVALFGSSYERYRERVPAVFPRLWSRAR
jgi:methanethiol S-methyltransferase